MLEMRLSGVDLAGSFVAMFCSALLAIGIALWATTRAEELGLACEPVKIVVNPFDEYPDSKEDRTLCDTLYCYDGSVAKYDGFKYHCCNETTDEYSGLCHGECLAADKVIMSNRILSDMWTKIGSKLDEASAKYDSDESPERFADLNHLWNAFNEDFLTNVDLKKHEESTFKYITKEDITSEQPFYDLIAT